MVSTREIRKLDGKNNVGNAVQKSLGYEIEILHISKRQEVNFYRYNLGQV